MMWMILVLLFLGWPSPSEAATCTAGTDCYCDKVRNVADPIYDASLLFCEDFEAPTLTQNTGVGNGAPYYGPWYDATGQAGNRGNNSYWNKEYGNGVSSYLFGSGQPSSPTLGAPCGFSLCVGLKVWDSTNRWGANAYAPLLAFYTQDSHFTQELPSLSVPTNTADGGDGVFDGNASLAWRVPAGDTHGIAGKASFPTVTEIGLTMAMAYPTNSLSSGIWGQPGIEASWKHNEWTSVNSPNCGFDGLFAFYNQLGPRTGIPFAGFMGAFGPGCTGTSYNGTITDQTAGHAEVSPGYGVFWNTPSNYSQPTDWPFGTWGCVRGHIAIGDTTERYRVWFQGPNMTSERLIIDVSFTKAGLDNVGGWNGMVWNAYANTNQGGGYTATTELTYRYEDNVHARNGVPISCAQIGFVGGGTSNGTINGGARFSGAVRLIDYEVQP